MDLYAALAQVDSGYFQNVCAMREVVRAMPALVANMGQH